jgi:hypothetical protein
MNGLGWVGLVQQQMTAAGVGAKRDEDRQKKRRDEDRQQ